MFFNFSQKKLIITSVFSFGILLILTWMIKEASWLQNFDNKTLVFLARGRTPLSNVFFRYITFFGSEEFLIPFTLILGIIFYACRKIPQYILFVGTMIGSSYFIFLLKAFIDRTRPEIIAPLSQETLPSFPSGHAALSVVFYGLLAYLATKTTSTKNKKTVLSIAWIIMFLLVGYSRLHLGVHFPSDVLAGYAAGFFWLSIGIIFFERLSSVKKTWWKKIIDYFQIRG